MEFSTIYFIYNLNLSYAFYEFVLVLVLSKKKILGHEIPISKFAEVLFLNILTVWSNNNETNIKTNRKHIFVHILKVKNQMKLIYKFLCLFGNIILKQLSFVSYKNRKQIRTEQSHTHIKTLSLMLALSFQIQHKVIIR